VIDAVPLRDVLRDAQPGFACGEIDPNGVVQVRMNNIADGILSFETVRRVPSRLARLERFAVEPGDVMFNATNSPELVGKVALFRGYGEPVVYSNHFLRLRPDNRKVDGNYLARWLHTLWSRGDFSHMCRQWVNQATVSSERLLSLNVPLPPVPEQRRIAAILDKADDLRAKRRAALGELDGLAQSVFVEMFGDGEAARYATVPLGGLLRFVTSGGRGWARFYCDHGARFIRSLDVQMNRIGEEAPAFVAPPEGAETERTRVQSGDVLLTITGSRIGRVAAVPPELAGSYVSQHVAILRPDVGRMMPLFLSFFLSQSGGQRQIAQSQYGQTKPGLNFDQIRRFQLPLPPLPVQTEFASRLAAVRNVTTSVQRCTDRMNALFESLQHRAFRGEL